MRLFQPQTLGPPHQRPHSLPLRQSRHLRVTLLRDLLNALVIFTNPFAQGLDLSQQRFQCRFQFWTQLLRLLQVHVPRIAAAQPFSVGLGQATGRIDQRRPRSYQARSRPDRHQIRLRLRAAMFHRRQQLRIDPHQSRQHSGIKPIIFFPTLSDQAHIARMRHDYFVPQFTQYPAYPRGVRPGFQRHPAARHPTEDFLHGLRRGRHLLFQNYFSRFIQNAVPTEPISQIQPDRELLTCIFFVLLCHDSANLLHCRSPLSPCASSASITWELIASRRSPAFSSHLVSSTIQKCWTVSAYRGKVSPGAESRTQYLLPTLACKTILTLRLIPSTNSCEKRSVAEVESS